MTNLIKDLTYEQAITRLEEITKQLENANESLEKSVELFQEGIELSNFCQIKLQNIEKKVASILVDNEFIALKEEE